MAQNIYDNAEFFEGYSQLKRSQEGLAGAPEWRTLKEMVGNVHNLRVLDLGCGYGWFSRWASQEGAARVHGVDVSKNMISKALEHRLGADMTYETADLETLELPKASFDLVYSSLTFHYLENLNRLIAGIRDTLSPEGHFVFSVEHPIFTAPTEPSWQKAENGRDFWPLDSYSQLGRRITNWFTDGVRKYHRTIETYVSLLLRNGFKLTRLVEWVPSDEDLEGNPEWRVERERPMFLLMAAEKAKKDSE